MKVLFNEYLSEEKWQIIERGWYPDLQQTHEAQFALGNGYLGSRAALEEIPQGASPGTYISGIYDNVGAQVTELVNVPNPIYIKITLDGEKLGVDTMDVVRHERMLDLKHGLLARQTIFSNRKKKRFDYKSIRFFGMDNPHLAAMQISLTPLNEVETLTIESSVDTGIMNKGLVTEGNKRHVHILDTSKESAVNYLCTKTLEKEILIAYASRLEVKKGNNVYSPGRRIFTLRVRKGETVQITKYVSIFTSRDVSPEHIKKRTINTLERAAGAGFKNLAKSHINAWKEKWKMADVEIRTEPDVERALRFNIYHMLIALNENVRDVSIGAKTLSGEGYRGHVFWDSEIFVLPFFIYTNPKIARNMLVYRYNRLDAARRIAKEKGFKGAMFPWESADTGEETTPSWYKSSDNTIMKVSTGLQEHHITGDISYGIYHYYSATDDVDFMFRCGLEMIFESARFWASRVKYNKVTRKYDIKHVIGPDEFHEDVKNNAYTNFLAKWNLKVAADLYKTLRRKHPSRLSRIMGKIDLRTQEILQWVLIAKRICMPASKQTQIIEEFDGFSKLKKMPLPERDCNYLPYNPKGLPISEAYKTQYVKQADVLMLMYLFPDAFPPEQKVKNYQYYEKRTLHKSSLSASIHSIFASEVGNAEQAYRYFLASLYTDMKNIYGSTADGIHSASLGGTWQAVINGFAGTRILKGTLSFNPRLPAKWNGLDFSIKWKGFNLHAGVEKDKITLKLHSPNMKDHIIVKVYDLTCKLYANKPTVFHKEKCVFDS
ncbi:MAG: glycoside hydrolase family 65 protein [Endomicrobiales bacterium]|nr:glycoside hydrolase family 65 protein [Endomicrobiales bacterium]